MGYRMATKMSPSSLEMEVKRMTRPEGIDLNSRRGSVHFSGKLSDGEDEGLPVLTQAEVESAMKKVCCERWITF